MLVHSLIESLSVHWDLWTGQYRAFFTSVEEDRRACFSLMEHNGISLSEKARQESKSRLAACQDTHSGEIVACLWLSDARLLHHKAGATSQYLFDLIDEQRMNEMAVVTHVAIHPAHLKTAAATALLSHCIIELLKAGGQAVLMACDPGHFSIYKRLGLRPIGPLRKSGAGEVYLPMIFLPDGDYLSIINSPVLPLLRGIDFEIYQSLCQWYYQLVRENSELQLGSAFHPENQENFAGHHAITEGLSEEGRETLLKNALVLSCREGEVLMRENDGGKAFGFVSHGMLQVLINGKVVVLLGEGDILGEIAFVMQSKRTAEVVAVSPETEVVLFNESAIDELELETDKTTVWRNLARVLAQRVLLTNKLLLE